jgi:transcriptional regulator with XRE-family HTH domain
VKATGKRLTKEGWLKHFKELEMQFIERARTERLAWLNRPRVHTAIFDDVARDEELAKMLETFDGRVQIDERSRRRIAERAHKLNELAQDLRLSGDRLALFKQLVVAYHREPTIEHYVRVRREFPEAEIQVSIFGGIDPFEALKKKFQEQGIDPDLILSALDSNEPSIDALSLCLLEKLVAKGKLPKDGPGHIEKRRNAISEATVNYLILIMLEGCDWNEEEVRIPASLIVLIREQLCGINPDLHKEYLSKAQIWNAAIAVAQRFPRGKMSVRKLAAALNVSRGKAARWLADNEFIERVEAARRWELLPNLGDGRDQAAAI